MYKENMSGFAVNKYPGISNIDESHKGPSPHEIAIEKLKSRKRDEIEETNNENDSKPMIAYQNPDGTPIIFLNNSLADGEKLLIRIMGDLYIFSAEHAHVVASFIFALGLYKGATDITPLIIDFVGFLNTLKPDMFRVVTVTKFAFYATTAFSTVLFWMGYDKNSIKTKLLDNLDTKYPFKTAGVDNVIFNHTIGDHILKNIHMGVVIKDFYGALACISTVFKATMHTIPTMICNATTSVCEMAKGAFTNIEKINTQINTILTNYLESDNYSESEESEQTIATINSTQSIATINSTQSILSSKSIASIMQTTNVESGSDPSSAIEIIIEANDKIVQANDQIIEANLEGTTVATDNNANISGLTTPADSQPQYYNNGGKSRRKNNKKTHKKHKKTHKKHNKKSHKKQRRSKKH